MTPGERMVWAAEFVRTRAMLPVSGSSRILESVMQATQAVEQMRALDRWALSSAENEMMADMLGEDP